MLNRSGEKGEWLKSINFVQFIWRQPCITFLWIHEDKMRIQIMKGYFQGESDLLVPILRYTRFIISWPVSILKGKRTLGSQKRFVWVQNSQLRRVEIGDRRCLTDFSIVYNILDEVDQIICVICGTLWEIKGWSLACIWERWPFLYLTAAEERGDRIFICHRMENHVSMNRLN
jgi:hypothetical protein